MRSIFLISCAALAVAACGRDDAANEANVMTDENMMVAENTMVDPMMNADANLATDPVTGNLIEEDLTTNDADTNLANGL